MELTHRFIVPAPIDEAWAAFNDLERIAPCFPGAELTSYDGEGFEGLVKVKLGPISLQYGGKGRFAERDETAHRAVIKASGRDKRGNGTAAATITATLEPAGDSATGVVVVTDLNVTGKPAQFGRGVMQDVSDRLLGQFALCLESRLGPSGDEAAPGSAASGTDDSSNAPSDDSSASVGTDPRAAPQGAPRPLAPAPALDLGATALPVLARRFGPPIIGGLVVLWVLKRLFRRF